MVGIIKTVIDDIIEKRSRGNPAIARTMRVKLKLKGIDIDKYDASSDDDPAVIARLNEIYKEMANPENVLVDIKAAYSSKDTVADAVFDIKDQLSGLGIRMVIYFASSCFNPDEISRGMQAAFKGATVFGCTTAGEIAGGKMLMNSVVAMAFGQNVVEDVKVEVLENIKEYVDVKPVLKAFESYYKTALDDMDLTKYVGILLVDGLSGAEEKIMDKVGYRTNITVIGGSAGDDLNFKETYVYANGRPSTNAAILALVKLKRGFDVIKTESFNILENKFVVTKADEARRRVIEFNGVPAAVAYAEAIYTDVPDAPNHFMHHPVGVIIDGEPYVRSPQKLDGNSIVFYCNIPEGMEVSLLESMDIVKDTDTAIKKKLKDIGPVSGMINFHCILRTLELDRNGSMESYGEIFSGVPTIGFNTYGEEYLAHINQTSTILVFK